MRFTFWGFLKAEVTIPAFSYKTEPRENYLFICRLCPRPPISFNLTPYKVINHSANKGFDQQIELASLSDIVEDAKWTSEG